MKATVMAEFDHDSGSRSMAAGTAYPFDSSADPESSQYGSATPANFRPQIAEHSNS